MRELTEVAWYGQAAKLPPPLARFLEAARRADERRRVAVLEKRMARQVARWFVDQGAAVVERLEPHLASRFDDNAALYVQESLAPSDWLWVLGTVLEAGAGELEQIIGVFAGSALAGGKRLGPPAADVQPVKPAVAWAEARGAPGDAHQRDDPGRLEPFADRGDADGWSWTRRRRLSSGSSRTSPAAALPSKKFRSRAEMVAAYEIGDACRKRCREMAAGDFPMEKAWLGARDVGDRCTRPTTRRADTARRRFESATSAADGPRLPLQLAYRRDR